MYDQDIDDLSRVSRHGLEFQARPEIHPQEGFCPFVGNKQQLKREVLPALIVWRQGKSGLRFSTEWSINLADDEELMSMMVDAGFMWTLFHRPRLFPQAIELAIYGYPFRRVCELQV